MIQLRACSSSFYRTTATSNASTNCWLSRFSADVCSLSPQVGHCRPRFLRYYYNSRTGQCQTFYYGGCGGNGNNFRSLSQCKRKCMPSKLNLHQCVLQIVLYNHNTLIILLYCNYTLLLLLQFYYFEFFFT